MLASTIFTSLCRTKASSHGWYRQTGGNAGCWLLALLTSLWCFRHIDLAQVFMWLYSDPPHPHSPLCWLLLSIYENCSKTELNFPPVHAFPHPCHPQLASAFGCSIELTDASQHKYLWANGVQNSRFLTEGVFIVLIPDLTDWNPCFQCGV